MLLPEPLRPMIPTVSPTATEKVTSDKAEKVVGSALAALSPAADARAAKRLATPRMLRLSRSDGRA
ncbi:hypothetical protein BURKHO8Y_210327 [Burkholderia sp. 8Y]|nr:hypothetical protein BURKHO8Y_210327 [Burkholderia sp. 8Y]